MNLQIRQTNKQNTKLHFSRGGMDVQKERKKIYEFVTKTALINVTYKELDVV